MSPEQLNRFGVRSIRKQGFSLIELMVVIVILGMLAGVVTISVRSYLIRAKQSVARVDISNLMQALDTFYTTYGRYPSNEEGLSILTKKSEEFPDGIIRNLRDDPWGHPYEYVSPGQTEPFEIMCFGADQREGGDGQDRDTSSNELE